MSSMSEEEKIRRQVERLCARIPANVRAEYDELREKGVAMLTAIREGDADRLKVLLES